jgi:hypothetical protein
VRCGSFQDGVNCISCRLPILADAEVCTSCKALQHGDSCGACGAMIAVGSRRCPECSSWQNWRRFFSGLETTFALVLALFSVVGAAAPVVIGYFTNYSETSIRILGGHEYDKGTPEAEWTIAVLIMNNGKRMSFIDSARIEFDGMDIRPAALRPRNITEQAVPPGKSVVLYFTGSPKTRSQAVADPTGRIRIIVNVDESDRKGNVIRTSRQDEFPAKTLNKWIEKHVATSTH